MVIHTHFLTAIVFCIDFLFRTIRVYSRRMISECNNNDLLDMPNDSLPNGVIPRAIVPDGGWGWVIVFSSFMIHFVMDG